MCDSFLNVSSATKKENEQEHMGSNLEPKHYKSTALSTRLWRLTKAVYFYIHLKGKLLKHIFQKLRPNGQKGETGASSFPVYFPLISFSLKSPTQV
jgi:hypothetical protein